MDAIIDRRIFFKIAATGVTGYFASPSALSRNSTLYGFWGKLAED